MTVLGACGAWPAAGQACSGFLIEQDDFRLVLDIGYATLPRLLQHVPADQVDAVVITHRHPDHCADLSPLLRARFFPGTGAPPLEVYSLPGAVDAVLALDAPTMMNNIETHDLAPDSSVHIGPFVVETKMLPHYVPNLGLRVSADEAVLTYTGDSGPCSEVVDLARQSNLMIAEATFVGRVPDDAVGHLSSAEQAGQQAREAQVARLLLTHLWPGTDPSAAQRAATNSFDGPVEVAMTGLIENVS
jgi:ribonuclease BN (tRNA processing enzyme)